MYTEQGRMTVPPVAAGRSVLSLLSDPMQRLTTAVLVVSLGLAPIAVFPAESPIYAGIATESPTLYTYTIAVVIAGVAMAVAAPRRFLAGLLPWLPFLVWLVVLAISTWTMSPRTYSGLLQLSLGAVAFAIGVAAQGFDRGGSVLAWVFAAVAWLQLLAIGLAAAGFPLRRITGPRALDLLGRAIGLTSHPGELAKLLFFCALCALTLPQRTAWERWATWLTLGAAMVGISLAQSRTVLAGTVAMVLIFVMLELAAGRWQRRHLVLIGLAVALGLASLPWLIQRFIADPGGGARQHITQVAAAVIAQHPWSGVGPNAYVAVVGGLDPLTATGVPAHNIFLLSAAEIGIAGAALLWLPFFGVIGRAAYQLWRTRGTDLAGRVLVSAVPGIALMAITGWGLLQGPYFLIFALVVGYYGAQAGARAGARAGTADETTGPVDAMTGPVVGSDARH